MDASAETFSGFFRALMAFPGGVRWERNSDVAATRVFTMPDAL